MRLFGCLALVVVSQVCCSPSIVQEKETPKCTRIGPCSCRPTLPNNLLIDLSGLTRGGGSKPRFVAKGKYLDTGRDYEFLFNPCADFSQSGCKDSVV